VFEWADGGSLSNLFTKLPKPDLNADLIKQTMMQLFGLSETLKTTYDLGVRHGDIKPANIIHFEPVTGGVLGTLKIGDWAISKKHVDPITERLKRRQLTDTALGTIVYEPPEIELAVVLLSRQHDIWSIGCVYLRFWSGFCMGGQVSTTSGSALKGNYENQCLITLSRLKLLPVNLKPGPTRWSNSG